MASNTVINEEHFYVTVSGVSVICLNHGERFGSLFPDVSHCESRWRPRPSPFVPASDDLQSPERGRLRDCGSGSEEPHCFPGRASAPGQSRHLRQVSAALGSARLPAFMCSLLADAIDLFKAASPV